MFKVNNKDQWHRSGIFIVNFEHILHLFLFLLLTFELVNADWEVNIARLSCFDKISSDPNHVGSKLKIFLQLFSTKILA